MENSKSCCRKSGRKILKYTGLGQFGILFNSSLMLTILKDTCVPVFIVALFTIARTWKKPRCPSTDAWVKKMWYIYTMEYHSAIKRRDLSQF